MLTQFPMQQLSLQKEHLIPDLQDLKLRMLRLVTRRRLSLKAWQMRQDLR